MSRPFNWERIIFSTNGGGTTVYSHAKLWIWIPASNIHKNYTTLINYLNAKAESIIKFLERNSGRNIYDIRSTNGFLNMTPNVQAANKNITEFNSTIINFWVCVSKNTIKVKRQTT